MVHACARGDAGKLSHMSDTQSKGGASANRLALEEDPRSVDPSKGDWQWESGRRWADRIAAERAGAVISSVSSP